MLNYWNLVVGIKSIEILSFNQAISIVPLQVQYYPEALPTQHGYCVRVSRQSATGNCEWRTCQRSLRGGQSEIRTYDPSDERLRIYQWAATPNKYYWFYLLLFTLYDKQVSVEWREITLCTKFTKNPIAPAMHVGMGVAVQLLSSHGKAGGHIAQECHERWIPSSKSRRVEESLTRCSKVSFFNNSWTKKHTYINLVHSYRVAVILLSSS